MARQAACLPTPNRIEMCCSQVIIAAPHHSWLAYFGLHEMFLVNVRRFGDSPRGVVFSLSVRLFASKQLSE